MCLTCRFQGPMAGFDEAHKQEMREERFPLDLMFVAMQRYNRPLVVRLAERQSGKRRKSR